MRVFVAIDLPEDIKASLFHSSEFLQKSGLLRANFVEKENLHLTLKFLGDLEADSLEKVKDELKKINFKKFNASLGKVGSFPYEDYVKVLHVELNSENNEIKDLQKEVEVKLKGMGFKEEAREFSSHVTLARVHSLIKAQENKQAFLDKLKSFKVPKDEFEVNKFILIKSELMAKGPVYKVIEEYSLK